MRLLFFLTYALSILFRVPRHATGDMIIMMLLQPYLCSHDQPHEGCASYVVYSNLPTDERLERYFYIPRHRADTSTAQLELTGRIGLLTERVQPK
jgi:hypothetical protein